MKAKTPISVTGTNKRTLNESVETGQYRQRGMTLIELLVMVIIIGIVLAVLVPKNSWIRSEAALRGEVNRFASVIELARDEAALQGRNFGIRFYPDGYALYELDADTGAWVVVGGDDLLRGALFAEGTLPILIIEDREITLEPVDDSDVPDPITDALGNIVEFAPDTPHVAILASGEMTPFSLELNTTKSRESLQLNGDFLGQLDIVDLELP